MKLAEAEWMGLMQRSGTRGMLREDGALELYESDAEFQASLPGWAARDRFGIEYRHLAKSELADYQPGLAPSFMRGTFVPGWKTVSDPKDLGKAIWRYAEQKGAVFVRGDVGLAMPSQQGGSSCSSSAGAPSWRGRLVIAAGAWSHLLARQFGDRVPLETERGYNTTLPKTAFDVKRQLIFPGPRLRHHAAGDRAARRRRRRARRPGAAAQFRALQGDAGEGAALPAGPRRRPAAANGWAIARRCRIRCRSSAARARRRTSSTPSATAISA